MFQWCDCYVPVVGRVLMGGYFLWSGVLKLASFNTAVALATRAELPQTQIAAAIVIAIEMLLGVALVLGWRTRAVALTLVVWTAVATFIFKTPLLEVLAIMGGLLYMSSFGSGGWSVSSRT